MSVAILPIEHLAALVAHGDAVHNRLRGYFETGHGSKAWIEVALECLDLLERANHRAYAVRYNEDVTLEDCARIAKHKRDCLHFYREHPVSAVQAIELVRCFDYNSTEDETIEGQRARRFTARVQRKALDLLPGMAETKWVLSGNETEIRKWNEGREAGMFPVGPIHEW